MEPNVEMDPKLQSQYCGYRKCLADKIKLVCSKVGFRYSDIKWIIFDPKIEDIYGNKPDQVQQIFIGRKGKDYGASNLKDTIWISTLAIHKELVENLFSGKSKKIINMTRQNKEDFLADVILDEIAHIATRCKHGNHKYDTEFHRYRDLYYNNVINQMLYTKRGK